MRLDVFTGRDLTTVCDSARASLGDDAMILHTRSLRDGDRSWIEVEAAAASDVNRLVRLLTARPPHMPPSRPLRGAPRPRIVAVVGPTGAGKTTTLAKLAVNPEAYGNERVGFITLDTHRAGAFEQLQAYADAAGLACEIVYDRAELALALKRLANCDVILVDTPGRGPRSGSNNAEWRTLLKALRADEVHLAVPATTRRDLIAGMGAEFASLGATHTLMTSLDEVPANSLIAMTIAQLGLHASWVTVGQDVPSDIRPAAPAVLKTLGLNASPVLA